MREEDRLDASARGAGEEDLAQGVAVVGRARCELRRRLLVGPGPAPGPTPNQNLCSQTDPRWVVFSFQTQRHGALRSVPSRVINILRELVVCGE